MHDHGHDHTHEPDPVEQLAYKELSARYGILFGDMTRADTKVQVLLRREAALRQRVEVLEVFLAQRGMLDHEGMPVDPVAPEPVKDAIEVDIEDPGA